MLLRILLEVVRNVVSAKPHLFLHMDSSSSSSSKII